MRTRLYIVAALFLLSFIIAISPAFTGEKLLDIKYSQLTSSAKKQVDCLAENIYYEAGHEPADGKTAVALVTMNRVQDPRYPKDICSVVKQKVNSTCQFSWYCEGKKAIRNFYAYEEAKEVAVYVYANYENLKDITKGALYYHADYVNPRWKLQKTVVIGRHIFYKEKGGI
jgi:spore germination cell wall hydrolase CwlJ-like protein